jgi:hypothetical protein
MDSFSWWVTRDHGVTEAGGGALDSDDGEGPVCTRMILYGCTASLLLGLKMQAL